MKAIKNTLWITASVTGLAVLALTPAVSADIVHNDDVIIDGSLCVGFDCVNGENFGFDTIRLKENNLRIHFQDTSNSASFPDNDWRIRINDSSNGGDSYFGIEDSSAGRVPFRIEAGARSNALFVESTGDIGIGTSTPAVDIHIATGDTPTVRLEQNGTSGWTPQTWDLAGNETNFFVRDVTNGSKLPFRIRPGAATSAIDIQSNGLVQVSPGVNPGLKVKNAGAAGFDLDNTATGEIWRMVNSGATDNSTFIVTNTTAAGAQFTVQEDGDIVAQGDVFSASCPATPSPGTPCLPDYVFEPDYELMPIAELADFVARKKHLPNVPSEDDFRAAGSFSMGQFQKQLLEKIEELTLYTIQQQEQIDKLTAQLTTEDEIDG